MHASQNVSEKREEKDEKYLEEEIKKIGFGFGFFFGGGFVATLTVDMHRIGAAAPPPTPARTPPEGGAALYVSNAGCPPSSRECCVVFVGYTTSANILGWTTPSATATLTAVAAAARSRSTTTPAAEPPPATDAWRGGSVAAGCGGPLRSRSSLSPSLDEVGVGDFPSATSFPLPIITTSHRNVRTSA